MDQREIKWYQSRYFIIAAFLAAGPFALPLVWLHPSMSRKNKIVITLVTAAVSVLLGWALAFSLRMLKEYYSILQSM